MLKYVLVAFATPPGLFVTLSALAGAWFLSRKGSRLAGAAHLLFAAAFWSLSTVPVSDRLIRDLAAPYLALPDPRGDAIVLLGGGVSGGAPDLTGTGSPSAETHARIATAVRLQGRLGVPVIVTGGKVFEGKAAEAPIVKRFLVDLGVPSDKVVVEDGSRDTAENARLSAAILRERGLRRPIVVTSAYHLKRAMRCFEREGVEAVPFPASFRTWKGKVHGPEDYLPGAEPLRHSSSAVREYIGLIVYRIAY